MERWRTIFEPFRIHSVEPIGVTSVADRERALAAAGWNLFHLHGDESYAGSPSWFACATGSAPPPTSARR